MFMKLDWGNVLKFADEREYYEVLGFLAKDEEYIRVYTESNDKSGAWAPQGRLLLRNVDISSIPEPLMKAFETSLDGRITRVKNLAELYLLNGYTKSLLKKFWEQCQKNMKKIFIEDIIGIVK